MDAKGATKERRQAAPPELQAAERSVLKRAADPSRGRAMLSLNNAMTFNIQYALPSSGNCLLTLSVRFNVKFFK